MIHIHHKKHSNMLFTEVNGLFSKEYFNKVFIPKVESILKEFPRVNIVLNFDKDLSGWTLLCLLKKFIECISPYNAITRVAILSDNTLLKLKLSIFQSGAKIPTERFHHKDIEKAKAWLAIG